MIRSRLSDERVHDIFEQSRLDSLTHLTETNPGKLLERVHRVARRAYEGGGNETVLGDISLAASITDYDRMAADVAINVSVPTFRWSIEHVEAELARRVWVAATSVSKARPPNCRRGAFGESSTTALKAVVIADAMY